MSSTEGKVECFQILIGAFLLVRAPNSPSLSTNHREKSSIGGTQETRPNKDPNEYKDYFKRALTQYPVKLLH